jgi:type III secretion protein T
METEFLLYPSTWIGAAFLAMPRMLMMFSLLPIFNRQALPGLLRIGVAFTFALFVVPSLVSDAMQIAQQPARLFTIVAK